MRLVRDDVDVELTDQQDELEQQPAAEDAAPTDSPLQNSDERSISTSAEQPDGTLEDTAADEKDDASEAADVQVDLRTLEALLFSTHHPLTAGRLAELLELESTKPIRRAIRELNEQYITTDRSFRVEQVAGGFQLLTLPDFGDILKKLHQKEIDAKL